MTSKEQWRADYEAAPRRDADFETMSGVPLEAVYGPEGGAFPGAWPYTRGPYASMYRSKPWTMRMFAGFGTAEDTNGRFREILRAGGDGLSTAFDLPTLMGRDSDDPHSLGEVGKCGVAIDTLADMEDLFRGIDLGEVTTSMTINSPAPILLAMYVAVAEENGVERARLGGTLQNDILKEYQAQKEFIFPPRPSMRLVTDVIRFCAAEMPKWHPVSISGYHIREAGSTAAQELAFTLADGIAYVEAARSRRLDVDAFAGRLSFFFAAWSELFEEVAKFRAARRMWAHIMRERFGARDPRSMMCRFHVQTAGSSLTAQSIDNNVVRTTIQALAAVLGGAQSLHTNARDEALALPTEESARLALRTQQILAYEAGVTETPDPLAGSYFVETLTTEVERAAQGYLDEIEALGGTLAAIAHGYQQRRIQESAYRVQRAIESGERIVVGVNRFADGAAGPPAIQRIDPAAERRQVEGLHRVRAERDHAVWEAALARLAEAARGGQNLLPAMIEAVAAYATLGEISDALRAVWGEHRELITV